MRFSSRLALAAWIAAVAAVPSAAQVAGNALPSGESLPATWTVAAAPVPTSPTWAAEVAYFVDNIGPGDYTYWYRVTHLGPAPGQREAHLLKSVTVNFSPEFIQTAGSTWLFGQYEPLAIGAVHSLAAEQVTWDPNGYKDSSVRWSHANTEYSALAPGDVIYLWVKGTASGGTSFLSLQNGYIGQTIVPIAHAPEPGAVVVLGCGAVSMLFVSRRRK